jgi:ABC-2 type transport system permease protein
MRSRILTIANKEFIHIRRDPRTLTIIIFIPIFMLMLFGYALTLDVNHISTAIVDLDRSSMSRDFVSKFGNSKYFDLDYYRDSVNDLKGLIDSGKVSMGIVIPPDFSRKISSGRQADVQMIIDGSNSNTAAITQAYANMIGAQYGLSKMTDKVARLNLPATSNLEIVKYDPRFWYNPDLKSINFLIPGQICIILMMLSTLLTSLSIVGEKESGTIESLVVSPIRTRELVLGKIIPYIILDFFDIALVIGLGSVWFGVPIKGNLFLLFALSFLFLISALGIGLLVSTVARNAQEAYMMSLFSTMLPTIMLSGYVFPISSMPVVLQVISNFIPAKYFLIIIRGIFLKGVGLSYLWPSSLALLAFGVVMILLSISRFRKRLT